MDVTNQGELVKSTLLAEPTTCEQLDMIDALIAEGETVSDNMDMPREPLEAIEVDMGLDEEHSDLTQIQTRNGWCGHCASRLVKGEWPEHEDYCSHYPATRRNQAVHAYRHLDVRTRAPHNWTYFVLPVPGQIDPDLLCDQCGGIWHAGAWQTHKAWCVRAAQNSRDHIAFERQLKADMAAINAAFKPETPGAAWSYSPKTIIGHGHSGKRTAAWYWQVIAFTVIVLAWLTGRKSHE